VLVPEVPSDPELDADDLVGLDEVAAMLGTARETALRYTRRADFPPPEEGVAQSGVWWRRDVEDWLGLPSEEFDEDEAEIADGESEGGTDPLVINVSEAAAALIQARGGRLFLWTEQVGMGVRDRVSSSPPPDLLFECRFVRPLGRLWNSDDAAPVVQICVWEDFPFAVLRIRTQRWPLHGLRIYVDGERFGWRGSTAGFSDPPGTYGY
jgi:predicted DNA-binding transcriptional regulator AlpA